MSYNEESKKFYLKIHEELLAYELFLNKKYWRDQNNSAKILLNDCLNKGWLLSDKEKELLLKNAVKVAKNKYKLKFK